MGDMKKKSWLENVDHITYVCHGGTLRKWAWYHIEVEGGTLISRIDDVRPDSKDSSMAIWCIDHGTFGTVLIEGIDRNRISQVSAFGNKHGDHTVQHIAFNTRGLASFRERIETFGGQMRGDTLVRNDGFGILSQVFGRGFESGKADEMPFPEYVERPRFEDDGVAPITISKFAGKGFYVQIEEAVDNEDSESLIDLDKALPADWEVPEVQPPINSAQSQSEKGNRASSPIVAKDLSPRGVSKSAVSMLFVIAFFSGALCAAAASRMAVVC